MSVFAQLQQVLAKVNTLCAHLTRDMWRLMLHRHLSVCVHVCLECVLSGDLQTGGGVQAPVQVDAAQVRKESLEGVFGFVDRWKRVVSQDERDQAWIHEAEFTHLRPLLQLVICDMQQPQGRALYRRHAHTLKLVQTQKQLLQSKHTQENKQMF